MEKRLSALILQCGKPAVGFKFRIFRPELKRTKDKNAMIEVTITNEEKVKITLAPTTSTGKPAKVDGVPTWTVSSGDSTVVPEADGLSAYLVSSDTPGTTEIAVEADADLGAGVVTISDSISLVVAGAQAVRLGLTVGTPEPK
jgi:hypothetical protein